MRTRIVPVVLLQLAIAGALVSAKATAQPVVPHSLQRARLEAVLSNADPRLAYPVPAGRLTTRLPARIPLAPQSGEANRTRNAIIGGVIGSAVGIGVCTGISSLTNDSANGGFSTCTVKGNLMFGVGGF